MPEVITQINKKINDQFQESIPIGSRAQYIEVKFQNPDTQELITYNLQDLIDNGLLGGKIAWTKI